MPLGEGREVGKNGEDENAGRERRPTVEADRDVNAPISDSAEAQQMRDTTFRYNQARDALNALTAGLTDAAGNLDYTRADPTNQYEKVPFQRMNIYADAEFLRDAMNAEDIVAGAEENGVEMNDFRQDMIDQNRRDLSNAMDEYDRRRKDLSKAAADLAKADGAAKSNMLVALLALISVAGVLGSAILAYFLVQANKTQPGDDTNTAFNVVGDTVTGFKPGQRAKINVLANDTGADPATVAIVGADATGVLKVAGEGTWSIDQAMVVFNPDTGFLTDPTAQKYSATALAAVDENGTKRKGEATVTLKYNGDFDVPSILLTTYVDGADSLPIKFLENAKGADASTAKLVDSDAGNDLQKTAANEGIWTIDLAASTLTFAVGKDASGATFAKDPSPVSFSVASTDGTRTAESLVVLIDAEPEIPDVAQKANYGSKFTVSDIDVKGIMINQASIEIYDANGAVQNPLVVPGEGSWSVDSAGVITFDPVKGFENLPSAISASVEDMAGRRSAKFQITAMPFVPPFAASEIVEPVDSTNPGTPVPITLGQATEARVLALNAANDVAGDFAIDKASTQIIGLMPFDGAIPSARFLTPGKALAVNGEGTWRVNPTGDIFFKTVANFARWPTPLAYTIADVKGNQSNIGFIWITPDGKNVDAAMVNSNAKTDDAFWTLLSTEVLKKQYTLSEVLAICVTLEALTRSGIDPQSLARLDAKSIVSDADVMTATRTFVLTNNSSAPTLEAVTAFVDNAYVNTQDAGLGSVALATRITRLRLIQTIIRTDLAG